MPVTLVSTKACRRVRGHVRLVQRGGVQHRLHAVHARAHERAVGDRADALGVGRRQHVDAERLVLGALQRAHQRFAEMSGAAGDEDSHGLLTIAYARCSIGAAPQRRAAGQTASSSRALRRGSSASVTMQTAGPSGCTARPSTLSCDSRRRIATSSSRADTCPITLPAQGPSSHAVGAALGGGAEQPAAVGRAAPSVKPSATPSRCAEIEALHRAARDRLARPRDQRVQQRGKRKTHRGIDQAVAAAAVEQHDVVADRHRAFDVEPAQLRASSGRTAARDRTRARGATARRARRAGSRRRRSGSRANRSRAPPACSAAQGGQRQQRFQVGLAALARFRLVRQVAGADAVQRAR